LHIAIEGLDGVGKTSTAIQLAGILGAEYFSKALHQMNEISGKYENFVTLRELSSDNEWDTHLGLRGAFLCAKHMGLDMVTERYYATNYWANDIPGRFEELTNTISLIGEPDLTVILYSDSKIIHQRMYGRNPQDKDFPKLALHDVAYARMIEFVTRAEIPAVLFDTSDLTLEQVTSELAQYIQDQSVNCGRIKIIGNPPKYPQHTIKNGILSIEDGVTHIRKSTLQPDISVRSILIPASVENIALDVWDDWELLENIFVNKNNMVYYDVNGVLCCDNQLIRYPRNHAGTSLRIPDSVTELAHKCFFRSNIRHVTLHDDVTHIGFSAFFGCTRLEELNICRGLSHLGRNAFGQCHNIRRLVPPEGYTFASKMLIAPDKSIFKAFSSDKIPLLICPTIKAWAFEGYSSSERMRIETGAVEAYAFMNSRFQSLVFEDVRYIGDMAFWNCNHLNELEFQMITPPKLGCEIFRGIVHTTITIKIPTTALDAYRNAFAAYARHIRIEVKG
jgi:thymidylate kinase